jgi:hypothetical protein
VNHRRSTTARWARSLALAVVMGATLAAGGVAQAAGPPTVFASGLDNPRGLTFGPDGNLYVAEAGTGGSTSTIGTCPQVGPPIGPYTGGDTARISRFAPDGTRTTVADGLPSAAEAIGEIEGAADVAFLDGQLYALISGGGCSHGHTDAPNGVVRVNADGTTTPVADLSAFLASHPVAAPPPDLEPDGTWFSMAVRDGAFYVVDANQGDIDKVMLDGTVSRVFDGSARLGHVVPTAIASWNGRFFFGNLGTFPIAPGSQSLWKLTAGGHVRQLATGLSTVLSVVVTKHGKIYALESMTMPGFPGPDQLGSGSVVQVKSDGTIVPVATGLSLPTDMVLGPDHALYVSNLGFGGGPGAGQIMRIALG